MNEELKPTEIEVTPAMVEAGAEILERSILDVPPTMAGELAEEIIRAAFQEALKERR